MNIDNIGNLQEIITECQKNPQKIMELADHPDIANTLKCANKNIGPREIKTALNGMQSYIKKNKIDKLLERSKKGIVINSNRKTKVIDVPIEPTDFLEFIQMFLETDMPLSKKIFNGNRELIFWYNPLAKSINKLATKYMGFKVGGKIVVIDETKGLTELLPA